MTVWSSWSVGRGVVGCRRSELRERVEGFDYDLSIGVRDDDRAVVGDDEDLVEGVVHIDHVGD